MVPRFGAIKSSAILRFLNMSLKEAHWTLNLIGR